MMALRAYKIFSNLTKNLLIKPLSAVLNQSCILINATRFYADQNKKEDLVTINFKLPSGKELSGKGKVGDSILDIVVNNSLDIDGYGACEGTLACSTCHLIFKEDNFKEIKNAPLDEELDMLDLAYGLTETSRLGCQIILKKEMDDWEVIVPSGVADARDV